MVDTDKEALRQARLAFLEDTIQYYSEDTSRRATQKGADGYVCCRYRTTDGRKCGIGRHIPDDKYIESMEGKAADAAIIMEALPVDIQNLGGLFLSAIQLLHDVDGHWDMWKEKGLTDAGKAAVDDIKEQYGLFINS